MPATTNPYQWRTTTTTPGSEDATKTDNWPKCAKCHSLARPAILMFQDTDWLPDQAQEERWSLWVHSILKLCKKNNKKHNLKVCILEIGCGMNVPTCRVESERLADSILEHGGKVQLIRINPDFPLTSFLDAPDDAIIPIMSRGLQAIEKMDHYYNKLQRKQNKKKG